MNYGLVLTLTFMLAAAAAMAVMLGGIVYLDSQRPKLAGEFSTSKQPPTSPTSSTTTTTQKVLAESSTTTTASTSTTDQLKPLQIVSIEGRIYRLDDVEVVLESLGKKVDAAAVYLNGEYAGSTVDGKYVLLSMKSGEYEVTASKNGYSNATMSFSVESDTYSSSVEVRSQLTAIERQRAYSEGKADVRIYETSFCPNCRAVSSKLDKLVDDNRVCVVYEKLSYYRHADELSGLFAARSPLPLIVVEGEKGLYKASGLVSMSSIKQMIKSASGCEIG